MQVRSTSSRNRPTKSLNKNLVLRLELFQEKRMSVFNFWMPLSLSLRGKREKREKRLSLSFFLRNVASGCPCLSLPLRCRKGLTKNIWMPPTNDRVSFRLIVTKMAFKYWGTLLLQSTLKICSALLMRCDHLNSQCDLPVPGPASGAIKREQS